MLVWLDERGFTHDMPRTCGYSMKGELCYSKYDWGAKGRTKGVGALVGKVQLTVVLLSGSVDTEVFTCWVAEFLLPNLPARCVIILDNAAFHKGQGMKKSIMEAGHTLLYLAPYSPDLNSIEKKWAHAKHIRRTTSCSIDDLFKCYV